jgi:hypothetical protein
LIVIGKHFLVLASDLQERRNRYARSNNRWAMTRRVMPAWVVSTEIRSYRKDEELSPHA